MRKHQTLNPIPVNGGLNTLSAVLMCLTLSHCVSYENAQLVPELTLSPEQIELAPQTDSAAIDFGLDVGANESDSLFNLETLPGVRVRALDAGGAAAASGIRVGDVILEVNTMQINAPDALAVLEATGEAGNFDFRVRRDTTVFAATVEARAARSGAAQRELYRIDPLATRAGYRTERVDVTGEKPRSIAAARVVERLTGSPLIAANIAVDELIIALEGRDLSSAQDLINRLNREHDFGARVSMDVFDGSRVRRESVQLWHPGRKISRVSLGPIAQYEASQQADSKQLTLLNLWLFSLYNYSQVGSERVHSLLGLFEFASDYGELVEESQP